MYFLRKYIKIPHTSKAMVLLHVQYMYSTCTWTTYAYMYRYMSNHIEQKERTCILYMFYCACTRTLYVLHVLHVLYVLYVLYVYMYMYITPIYNIQDVHVHVYVVHVYIHVHVHVHMYMYMHSLVSS